MTHKDLITEARELCSKATPGPWQVKLHNEDYGQGYGETTFFVDMGGTLLKIGVADTAEKYTEYNTLSTFIARSRALISELCDALEKERGVMKHDWYKNDDGTIDSWAWESGFHNGPMCQYCGYAPCEHCTPDYDTGDCPGAPAKLQPTNADCLRAMSDEELANELTRNPPIPCRMCEYWDYKLSLCRAWTDDFTCTTGYAEALTFDWLQSPAEMEG